MATFGASCCGCLSRLFGGRARPSCAVSESSELMCSCEDEEAGAAPAPKRRPVPAHRSLWADVHSRLHHIYALEEALGFRAHDHHEGNDSLPEFALPYDDRIELLPQLPLRLQQRGWRDWRLVFSSVADGCSLTTLYERCAGQGATLLLVRDARGHVFGAFAAHPWARQPDGHFHGTGESFLFSTWPHGLRAWRWAGANGHFQLAAHDCLAFGGGGHFGLYLDAELRTGSTGRCETYDNEPLTEHHVAGGLDAPHAGDSAFEVHEVQVWAIGS